MSLPPLDEFMAIDPNSYLESVPGWGVELKALASDYTEYKSSVYAPGGTDWWGKTATASQDKAGEDSNAIASIHDTVDGLVSEVTSAVTYGVVPPLNNGHNIVDNARQTEGVTVNQDYTMSYAPPEGMSEEQAEKNKQTVEARARELKESAEKWYSASQGVADQIHAAESKISGAINLSAVGSNGHVAVRDAVAATNPAAASIPSDIANLKGLDPAATTPAGAAPGSLTDALSRMPRPTDQPDVPLKDKLGKPEIPIPKQDVVDKDVKKGTLGKDLKDPKSPPPGGVSGRWGEHSKIGSPEGPRVYQGKTGEHGTQLTHHEWEGKIPGADGVKGRWDVSADEYKVTGGAEIDVRKDGIITKEHAGAYLKQQEANAYFDFGDNGKLHLQAGHDQGIEENAKVNLVEKKGIDISAGGMVGDHGKASINYEGHGIDATLSGHGYVGAGGAAGLTLAETEDHKWKVGGSFGAALGRGGKGQLEITIDPKEFGSELGKLWGWIKN